MGSDFGGQRPGPMHRMHRTHQGHVAVQRAPDLSIGQQEVGVGAVLFPWIVGLVENWQVPSEGPEALTA